MVIKKHLCTEIGSCNPSTIFGAEFFFWMTRVRQAKYWRQNQKEQHCPWKNGAIPEAKTVNRKEIVTYMELNQSVDIVRPYILLLHKTLSNCIAPSK